MSQLVANNLSEIELILSQVIPIFAYISHAAK